VALPLGREKTRALANEDAFARVGRELIMGTAQTLELFTVSMYQGPLLGATPPFDLRFAPNGGRFVGEPFVVEHPPEPALRNMLCPVACLMIFETPLEIVGVADLQATVTTLDDINDESHKETLDKLGPFDAHGGEGGI
jgi:hypothetical protein